MYPQVNFYIKDADNTIKDDITGVQVKRKEDVLN